MIRYTAHGKQIKRGPEHIADAADETYAQIIADALNGERCPTADMMKYQAEQHGSNTIDLGRVMQTRAAIGEYHGAYVGVDSTPMKPGDTFTLDADGVRYTGVVPEAVLPLHNTVPRPDGGYNCSCGRSWDRDEGDECPGAV